jgi:hypothetical protein
VLLFSFLGGADDVGAGFFGAGDGLATGAGLSAGAGFAEGAGADVSFFGGCAAPLFLPLSGLGLVSVFVLVFVLCAGGASLLGCSAGGTGLAGLLPGALDGLTSASLLGLAPGAVGAGLPAVVGFAALAGCAAGLVFVLGCALGLVAGLYSATLSGAERPTGIALADGVIFVTTGWVASDAGGRAKAGAGWATPATL